MDPNTKRLALIAGGIAGSLLLLVGAWSLSGHHSGGVPVVEPDTRPLRVKPLNPGGLEVVGQEDAIISGATSGAEAMAPPPESPAPRALKAQPPVGAAPAASAPPAAGPPAPALATPVAVAPPKVEPPATVAPPAAAPVPHTAVVAPAPVAKATTSATSGALAQLAAVQSEQAALSEWQRLAKKMPELLANRRPAVVKAEHDGKVFWRLRTSGFADAAAAKAFCSEVRAKGGACSVASF
jgi:hypothetical protein